MKKIPFLLLLVVLVCVSCSKGNKTVLKASFQRYQGSDAKAVLTGENYLMWTSGDLIRINNNSVAISGDGSDAVFEMEASPNGYAAFFPYSAVSSAPNGSAEVDIRVFPDGQAFSVANDGVTQLISAPMAAYSSSSTGNVDLQFSNLCSLIKVKVTNNTHQEFGPLGKLVYPTLIQVFNDNCILAGNGVISNLASSPSLSMTDGDISANLTFPADVYIPRRASRYYYVVVPPLVEAQNLYVCVFYKIGGNSSPEEAVVKAANGLFSLPANSIATIDFQIEK